MVRFEACCREDISVILTKPSLFIANAFFQAGRFKPICCIRDIKVLGLTPKSSAAPSTPLIFHPVFCRTATRFSRLRRRISDSVRYSSSTWSPLPDSDSKRVGSTGRPVVGRSNSRAPPRAKMTARSITFRSSRMLPGQSAEGSAGQFHTTRWTLVLVSAQNESQVAQAALAELCQIYWYPLYAFARRRGYSPVTAIARESRWFFRMQVTASIRGSPLSML